MGCAHRRGAGQMALLTTQLTGIWVHCDKGHKMYDLPMNNYPTCVLLYLYMASGQDQWYRTRYWKKSYSIQWGSLPPRVCLVLVGHKWSYKGFEPLFSRREKKIKNRFQLYAILEKAKLCRQ